MISQFDAACAVYIDRAIYVWGGQGEDVCKQRLNGVLDPEGWIRKKETGSATAARAIATYRQRLADGICPVLCVDCSAYIIEVLKALGIVPQNYDRTAKQLYSFCNSHPAREGLRKGDLVFYSKTGKATDISHVGYYMGADTVSEARGRDYGVVVTAFDDSPANWLTPWNLFGRIDAIEPFTHEEPEPAPDYPDEPLPIKHCKPVLTGAGYAVLQDALNSLGYTDEDGKPLDIDGKWGKRSQAAWAKAVTNNLDTISFEGVLSLGGIGDIKIKLKEEPYEL